MKYQTRLWAVGLRPPRAHAINAVAAAAFYGLDGPSSGKWTFADPAFVIEERAVVWGELEELGLVYVSHYVAEAP